MKQKDFENLIRMAFEIDELEPSAVARERPSANPLVSISFDRALFRRKIIRRLTIPLAAAVALLYVLLPTGRSVPPSSRPPLSMLAGAARPFDIAVCPVEPARNGVRNGSTDDGIYKVVAIFQTWRKECECHAWQLYEWEDDRSFAEMSPEQIHEIALDVTGAPPLEQLLCVAIAHNSADFPLCVPESCELVECLNEVNPSEDSRESAAEYATAVRACLPDTVRVVPQSFYHD